MSNWKYDWDIVKEYWLRSGESLKSVATKYGIPYQTVRRRAALWGWSSDWVTLRMIWNDNSGDQDMLMPFDNEAERTEYLNATKGKVYLK